MKLFFSWLKLLFDILPSHNQHCITWDNKKVHFQNLQCWKVIYWSLCNTNKGGKAKHKTHLQSWCRERQHFIQSHIEINGMTIHFIKKKIFETHDYTIKVYNNEGIKKSIHINIYMVISERNFKSGLSRK